MHVWITKFALTKTGIIEAEVRPSKKNPNVCVNDSAEQYERKYYGLDECHATKEEAVKKAEQMRASHIKSHQDQIAELEALKFE